MVMTCVLQQLRSRSALTLAPLAHLRRERAAIPHMHGQPAARLHGVGAVGRLAQQHALLDDDACEARDLLEVPWPRYESLGQARLVRGRGRVGVVVG